MNLSAPVEGAITHYFLPDVARQCADEVASAGGVEVFFVGRRDRETGLVCEVESHAYGTAGAVPALSALAQPGDVLIHNHPSGYLMPSDADLSIASSVGNMGVGFYIINNAGTQCRVVVKAQDPKRKVAVSELEIERHLSPGGDLGGVVDSFEDRPQQRSMALAIARAFNHDGIALIEAGTGTGKSFAYLLPAILFALRNGERVVVSTNTINLQEQLLHKDLPALVKALGEPVDVEIVKGRGNYVCKRKAGFARDEVATLIPDAFTEELSQVLQWIETSPTGDRQELPVPPRGDVWERVMSEADNCLRIRCPHYENCFFYNSRRRAARAKILIVNHSLLLSDLAVRRSTGNYTMAAVLPPYSRVVLDEAHHLEEVATRNLAQQVTRSGLRKMLTRLHRKDSAGGKGALGSFLDAVDALTRDHLIDLSNPVILRIATELAPAVHDLRDTLDFLFSDFCNQFLHAARIDRVPSHEELKIRLTPMLRADRVWLDECERLLRMMADEIGVMVSHHQEALEQVGELPEDVVERLINPMMEWQALVGRVEALRKTIIAFVSPPEGECQWVEVSQRAGAQRSPETIVRLCSAPVEVRKVLKEALHDKMKSEVLTSATLSVDQDFRFFADRCGIPLAAAEPQPAFDEDGTPVIEIAPVDPRPVESQVLSSPFDYRSQVFFGVPSDLPDPRDRAFDDELADLVNRAVSITGGRAFVLFTSYGQLRRVASMCEPTFRRLGITLLRHGDESRDLMIRRFREDETSVLFGTSSFWEGVDVKGRALELLILAKLPFSVPTEPIQEAQFDALKAEGRDPFTSLVVPRAVIRFKQGFGRLIRSRTDRGAVLVADKRVVQMSYGHKFLRSLGDLQVRKGDRAHLMQDMATFFRS